MTVNLPFWHPGQFGRRRPNLEIRGRVVAALRDYFAREDFAEVDTPVLQMSPGGEVHLQAFATELKGPRDEAVQKLYLQTSPEFAMKKLLVACMPKIFQLAHCFRNGERSSLHHPEFMMLEWYRSQELARHPRESGDPAASGSEQKNSRVSGENGGESLTRGRASLDSRFRGNDKGENVFGEIKKDCINLVRDAAESAGRKVFSARGMNCDPFKDWEMLSVAEAFRRHADIDLLATAPDLKNPDAALLAKETRRIGLRANADDGWDDLFFRIMGERVEPHLGRERPVFLCDYPVSMAALARPKPDDPRLAERFEIYMCGVELANGFGELTDAEEQERRLKADMALKKKLYGETWPVDEGFLAALRAGMPESAGVALGVDRLVMLCCGAKCIEDVLWAPVIE